MTAARDVDEDDDDASVLFSASQDGSLALWDIKGGDLLYKCQMTSPDTDLPITIQSADSDGTNVFVGTSTGQVWAYNVVDWMASAAAQGALGGACPLPAGRWTASESPITSLSCAGPGSLGRGSNSQSSSLLLTGAADGVVKQWEVLSRPGTSSGSSSSSSGSEMPSTRLEQWPKLPTQRLPKKAHLFRGHDMDVTALLPVDATKFLSASKDGTVRAWNPATGKELFRMDGFTEALRSLCLQEELLVTDGMKQFVCVHDFDVDAFEGGYELDYEED
jgi:WD40 repeat protein